jgi:hypothetical protein
MTDPILSAEEVLAGRRSHICAGATCSVCRWLDSHEALRAERDDLHFITDMHARAVVDWLAAEARVATLEAALREVWGAPTSWLPADSPVRRLARAALGDQAAPTEPGPCPRCGGSEQVGGLSGGVAWDWLPCPRCAALAAAKLVPQRPTKW